MASTTNYSEAAAREIAQHFGLRCTKVSKVGESRQMMVGDLLVQHTGDGGRACWKVSNVRAGYIGEAIAVAAYAQTNQAYPLFTPGYEQMRAFIQVRRLMAETHSEVAA